MEQGDGEFCGLSMGGAMTLSFSASSLCASAGGGAAGSALDNCTSASASSA